MKDKKKQVPEYLLRVMVLRFLDSRYPARVQYKELEKVMEAIICSPRELTRVLAYSKEKEFVKGMTVELGDGLPVWITVKITAKGIDYLEKLEEDIRLKVEEEEEKIGFRPYSQQQEKKNE